MSEMTDDARSTLNNLIETCRDGQSGFEEAAKGVGDPALRAELMQYSIQRREFAAALQQAVRTTGDDPQESGSLAASLHRGWMHVKQAVSSSDDYAVLSQCERGEDAAVDAYRDALGHSVPMNIDELVETQYAAVKHVHDRIRSLREAKRPVH